jgi:hypothetical protein
VVVGRSDVDFPTLDRGSVHGLGDLDRPGAAQNEGKQVRPLGARMKDDQDRRGESLGEFTNDDLSASTSVSSRRP